MWMPPSGNTWEYHEATGNHDAELGSGEEPVSSDFAASFSACVRSLPSAATSLRSEYRSVRKSEYSRFIRVNLQNSYDQLPVGAGHTSHLGLGGLLGRNTKQHIFYLDDVNDTIPECTIFHASIVVKLNGECKLSG